MLTIEGFETQRIRTSGADIHLESGGNGPPLLLLHGYPQTHLLWRKIAPALARDFTVICPDMRGYGDSSRPASDASHSPYSKRVMAQDMVEVMDALGFGQFSVAAHDRGARVSHRMALDHPDRVSRLILMDIVPTRYRFQHVDKGVATKGYHWYFLIQPGGLPERLIGADTEFFLRHTLASWTAVEGAHEEAVMQDYLRCFSDPEMIHATCEDYRAGATIDLTHDEEDIDRKIACPVHVLWGDRSIQGSRFSLLDVWRERATTVTGQALPCGHFLPEEAPDETLTAMLAFLKN